MASPWLRLCPVTPDRTAAARAARRLRSPNADGSGALRGRHACAPAGALPVRRESACARTDQPVTRPRFGLLITAGICAGTQRLRLLSVTSFPVSPRPLLAEFTVPD